MDDDKEIEEDGDEGDKVNFGSRIYGFTPHPFEKFWPHVKLQS